MTTFLIAAAGLLVGHAFDMFLDRAYTGEPLGGALYRCPACRAELKPEFALPLIGYARYLGRCPDCRGWLPYRGLILPAGAAALFAVSYLTFDEVAAGLVGGLFASVMLALTMTDLETRLLPNRIIYPFTLLAAALSWVWPDTSVLEVFIGGAVAVAIAVGLLLFSLPFGQRAFGMGDVKMIVMMGFMTGFPSILIGVFAGTLAAGIGAALLILFRLRSRRDYIPHGPFLALGGVTALFWGQDIWDWYTDS